MQCHPTLSDCARLCSGIDSIERSRATQLQENERGAGDVPAPRSFARVFAPVEFTDRSGR